MQERLTPSIFASLRLPLITIQRDGRTEKVFYFSEARQRFFFLISSATQIGTISDHPSLRS